MSKMNDAEAVMNHLLFHKALIDEGKNDQRLDRYLDILSEAKEGESLSDPMDESVRSVFDLVLNQGFDPWQIDLLEFTRLYTLRLEDQEVDLIVAGKLMHMAWSILRLQSEETLQENEREEELYFFDWDTEELMESDFEAPQKLYQPQNHLKETTRRSPMRPVSLMELLDAFEDARSEVKVLQERERTRRELKSRKSRDFCNNAHEEDLEQDVERTWSRILSIGAGPILMMDLFNSDLNVNLSTFLATLYLVRDGRLALWQDDQPHGDIYLEMKVDWMSGVVEDAPQTEITEKLTVV